MNLSRLLGVVVIIAGAGLPGARVMGQPTELPRVSVRVADKPKAISPNLVGIFFEDINYAADGGLYAELIQNRSFDFSSLDRTDWGATSFWTLDTNDGRGAISIDAAAPLHANNPTYAVLEVFEPGGRGGVKLINDGFDGMAVKAGQSFRFSVFARMLYTGGRWSGPASQRPFEGERGALVARLESRNGTVLAEAELSNPAKPWTKIEAELTARADDPNARFVLLMTQRGGVAIDMVSLFPADTFRGRANGLRKDLAQTIADLRPKFVRFPGGCLVHGNGIRNFYRWQDTVGPVETRRGQHNIWRYHQSVGLGYFEYFQFCEDIGAIPLPVVPAGVSCQNSDFTGGFGQQAVAMEDMPAYIDDVLNLIEFANGPADSTWGRVRAEAGHPEPFGLKYLGVGNEEHITPAFTERFKLIRDAIRAKHPEIEVVGTSGPSFAGPDYEAGWAFARQENVSIVDEHYYVAVDWFWDNLEFYDKYDRSGPKVYLGEYAAHERDRKNTLRSALAEAAYLTSLERNGDVVLFASYAPLLSKRGRQQWAPDLIYFDNTGVFPSVNYEVQKLFAHNGGSAMLPMSIEGAAVNREDGKRQLAGSCVIDGDDVIVKIVSRASTAIDVQIDLSAVITGEIVGTKTTLAGEEMAENAFGQPPAVVPQSEDVRFRSATFGVTIPPMSLTVLRVRR